ncbi:MAG: hypothetical protein QOE95_1105 [Gaiellaceae bacterium]|jgi:hypothetical protein|nr:hypothetical protein [Gaiellaceae bacterium]
MSYLPSVHRLLLAAFAAVAVSLLTVAIASAAGARAKQQSIPPSPSVSVDLRYAQRAEITVGPGEHVRLLVHGRVSAAARLFVVRLSDGARIFNGRLAEARSIELGRLPARERYTFAVSGASAGRVAFRADWSASRAP